MPHKLAIDFGTTNSVVARWDEAQARTSVLSLPGLGLTDPGLPALIPSLVYVEDGLAGRIVAGQAVRAAGLDQRADNRLFRDFKRGIVSGEPLFRRIDSADWSARDAGRHFLQAVLSALPCPPDEIEQLVLTAPVASFSSYLAWLQETLHAIPPERVRIVDESTAAALGYAVTEPGAIVLVFDFGGGTLDLSMVQLPESRAQTGGLLHRLRGGGRSQPTARVIAKSGCVLGGSDVDRWLLAEILARSGLDEAQLGDDLIPLLNRCEAAKIALSSQKSVNVAFDAAGFSHSVPVTRVDLEHLLAGHGFYTSLQETLERVLVTARRQGIFTEDIHAVLLVGGTALMPSVQRELIDIFGQAIVRADRPFTAVAEGALLVAAGLGLDDYLMHSYGLRHLDPASGQPTYDELLPQGSRCPSTRPVEVVLGASQAGQTELELVIGVIDHSHVSQVDVRVEDGQTVFFAQAHTHADEITPLNPGETALRLPLQPPGKPGQPRIKAIFQVDAERRLRVTATDLRSGRALLDNATLLTLSEGESAGSENGKSLIPHDVEDLAAYFRQQIEAMAAAENGQAAAGPAAPALSGREPVLLDGDAARGLQRLSLRRLGAMLNVLPPEAITLEAAASMLHSDEFYVRYNAARAMSRRADRAARQVMQAALGSGRAPTRASVARYLYGFTWFAGSPLIHQALADPDLRVREGAIYALCDWRDDNAYALAANVLRRAAGTPGGDTLCAAAAWALRERSEEAAVPVLEAALLAARPEVRTQVLEALGANATPPALPIVRRTITADPDEGVQYAAALSLVELLGEGCPDDICALLAGTSGPTRRAVLRAFFHATNYLHIDLAGSPTALRLIDALRLALTDAQPAVRIAAIWPLAWLQHPDAAGTLAEAYQTESDQTVRAEMVRIATALASPAAEHMVGQPQA